MTIVKGANVSGNVFVNDLVNFTINVTNLGPSNATNVNVTDMLPAGLEFVSAGGNVSGTKTVVGGVEIVTWNIPHLSNTSMANLWVVVKVITNGTFRNVAAVNSTENATTSDTDAEIYVNPVNNFTVIKSSNWTNNMGHVNELVNFTITITNNGPSNASNVNITDILDSNFEFNSTDGYYDSVNHKVVWYLGDMINGASREVWVVVKVITNGTFRNVATVNSTENATGTTNGTDITVNPVNNLTLIKYANVTGSIMVNDLVNFTINVTNLGPSNATNVNVTDVLPLGFEFVSAGGNVTGTKTVVGGRDVVTWAVGDLNDGSMVSLWVVVKVITNGTFTNVASVNSSENTTGTTNGTDITVNPVNNLTLIKYANVTGNIMVNDLVNFTINVTNLGPSNATNVNVSDVLPVGFEFVSAGGNVTGTKTVVDGREVVTWNVGNLNNNSMVSLWVVVKVITNGTFTNVAVVNSTENKTGTSNGTDVTADPVNNFTIIKYANVTGNIFINDLVKFTINITNNGPSNATNVNITDILDANFEYAGSNGVYDSNTRKVTWNVGNLINTGRASVWVIVKVKTNGTFRNVATVNSTENATGTTNGTDITVNPVNNLTLIKYANVTDNIMVNDLVNFTINVTNNGPSNASNVNITDVLPLGFEFVSAGGNVSGTKTVVGGREVVTWNVGDLNDGSMVSLWVVVKVITNGTFTNVASVNSSENTTGGSNGTGIVVNSVNNLTLIKYANVTGNVMAGDLVNFTINVTNHGPSNATNVNVTDVLPAGLEFVSAGGNVTGTRYIINNREVVIWNVCNLNNASMVSLWVVVKVATNGTFRNVAVVNSTENKTGTSNGTDVTADPVNNFTLIKYANVTGNIMVNDLVNFTINVTNNGPSDATNVNITDILDAAFEYVDSNGVYDSNTHKVTWNVGNLANATRTSVWVVVKVKTNGTFTNLATVNSTENITGTTNGTHIVVNPVNNLTIIKYANVTGNVDVGDLINFTINVTNHGPSNATNVNVTDVLPAGLEFVSAGGNVSGTKTVVDGKEVVTWNVGDLNNGEMASLWVVVKVTATGTITNVASVNSTENSTGTSNGTNVLSGSIDLNITKTVNVQTARYGDVIVYTIIVKNHGPDNATGVNVTERLSNLVRLVEASPSQGRYDSNTNIWYVGNLTNNAEARLTLRVQVISIGIIENFVNVTGNENDTNSSNNNYTSDNVTAIPADSYVWAPDIVEYYGIPVNVPVSSQNAIYVNYYITDSVGNVVAQGSLWPGEAISNLNYEVDTYTVHLTTVTDAYHYPASYDSKITILKIGTPIEVEAVNITYGDDETITVTVPGDRNGTVNITVGGKTFENLPIGNGTIKITVPDLAGGNYTVNATYSGDRNHYGNSTTTTFEVARAVPIIKIYVEDIWYKEVEILNVTVNAPGTVNITVNGITIEVPLNESVTVTDVLKAAFGYDGKATWNIHNLPVGTYPAYAVYNGNENYSSVSTSDVFIVKPLPTYVNVTVWDIYVGEDAVIKIKVAPGGLEGNVTILLEGKTYTVNVTGDNAELIVSGLKAGIKNVTVNYMPGNPNYLPSENVTTFKVSKILPPIDSTTYDIEYGENETIVIHLPSDATGTVTIIVDGKKYTATLEDGKATFKIPGLKPGRYDVEVYYSGDDKYLPTNTTDIFKVTKKEDPTPTPTPVPVPDNNTSHHNGIGLTRHATGNPLYI